MKITSRGRNQREKVGSLLSGSCFPFPLKLCRQWGETAEPLGWGCEALSLREHGGKEVTSTPRAVVTELLQPRAQQRTMASVSVQGRG